MATEPMAVRKYVRKNRSTIYNLSSKGALEYVIKAGYVSVSNSIRDSDGYSRFQVDNIKKSMTGATTRSIISIGFTCSIIGFSQSTMMLQCLS